MQKGELLYYGCVRHPGSPVVPGGAPHQAPRRYCRLSVEPLCWVCLKGGGVGWCGCPACARVGVQRRPPALHAAAEEVQRCTPGANGPSRGACAPLPLFHVPSRTRKQVFMSPTAEHIHDATATFGECQRLVHSGRKQAGIQYLMRRWRAIPAELHTRFLHDEFLTLPVDTQASMTDLLLVRSREAGIAERTAALRHQMRADREQTVRLDAVATGHHRVPHPLAPLGWAGRPVRARRPPHAPLDHVLTPVVPHPLGPHRPNRATTSFTLVGHSADFTPSVVQLAFWGGRHLQVLAQTRDRRGSPPCGRNEMDPPPVRIGFDEPQ